MNAPRDPARFRAATRLRDPARSRSAARLVVVKLGGSLLEDATMRAAALAAIASRWEAGGGVILVHGGGKRVDAALARHGIPRRVHGGLRVTDARTLEVVVGTLGGTVNKELVAELMALGVPATGISGVDGGTLRAERHPPVDGVDLGFVGRVVEANTKIARAILDAGSLPVVASLASGPAGAPLLNVNADAAASAIAVAFDAGRLVFLTDVEGLRDESGRIVRTLSPCRAIGLLEAGSAVTGGMVPKLRACLDAVSSGVREVVIAGPRRHRTALGRGQGGTRLVAA